MAAALTQCLNLGIGRFHSSCFLLVLTCSSVRELLCSHVLISNTPEVNAIFYCGSTGSACYPCLIFDLASMLTCLDPAIDFVLFSFDVLTCCIAWYLCSPA